MGRIVLFRVSADQARPAIVVRVWVGANGIPKEDSLVDLQVFLDGSNDDIRFLKRPSNVEDERRPMFTNTECQNGLAWRTSVKKGEAIGEWAWPLIPQRAVDREQITAA
jgi:hypothetical protein